MCREFVIIHSYYSCSSSHILYEYLYAGMKKKHTHIAIARSRALLAGTLMNFTVLITHDAGDRACIIIMKLGLFDRFGLICIRLFWRLNSLCRVQPRATLRMSSLLGAVFLCCGCRVIGRSQAGGKSTQDGITS